MFKSWRIILDVASRNGLILVDTKKIFDLTYNQVKKMATDYQQTKFKVYEAFMNGNMGHWITMPLEQNSFDISTR